MPLPGRDKTFALENCRNLLDKLEREITRLQAAHKNDDVTEMSDVSFNACVTAWHLCDWVFGDLTSEQRKELGFNKLEDVQQQALENRALKFCRQVATASKHWEISRRADPLLKTTVAADPDWNIYFEYDNTRYPVSDVLQDASYFWTQLIYSNKIAK